MTDQGPIVRPFPAAGSWVRRAACADADAGLFYDRGRNGYRGNDAKAICARCVVAAECLDYALACEEIDPYGGFGIWAGLTGQQRNDIRKQMREPA